MEGSQRDCFDEMYGPMIPCDTEVSHIVTLTGQESEIVAHQECVFEEAWHCYSTCLKASIKFEGVQMQDYMLSLDFWMLIHLIINVIMYRPIRRLQATEMVLGFVW